MCRRFKTYLTLAMFALCFATLGKAPRMPERMGHETLEMVRREGDLRTAS